MINLYKKYEELVNYVIVGGLTTVVSLSTKWILLLTILDAKNAFELQVAVITSWICAVAFAYVMNRIVVFKSKNKNILKELSIFSTKILPLSAITAECLNTPYVSVSQPDITTPEICLDSFATSPKYSVSPESSFL